MVRIHENRHRKNSIFERNSPIQTTNIARKIVNVIGPDHRTKGRRTHTDNIAAHNKKASQKSLPPIPQPISPRRSQGKNRALVGSGTIGGQVNQRTQSGIPGASARDGGIWPRNGEGWREWREAAATGTARLLPIMMWGGGGRGCCLDGQLRALRVYCFVYVPFVAAGMRCRREAAWGQRRRRGGANCRGHPTVPHSAPRR